MPRVPSRASAPASRTRARRSSAPRWRGSSPRRASTSTSRPAASCTSRCTPASRPTRIVFHGNNKSSDGAARRARRGRRADRRRLVRRARPARGARGATARAASAVLVRVTPGVEAHTHEYIETGTDDSKFGFGLQSGDALARGAARASRAARCGSPACTATSGRRCSGSTRSRPRSIAWSGSCATVETRDRRDGRRAEPRRRARRALRRERRRAVDRAVRRPRCTRRSRRRSPRTACGRARRSTVEPGRSIAGAGGPHALHGRHDQGDPGRAHLRRGRRRHERQPAAGHLRRAVRGVPPGARRPRRARRS